MYYTVSSESLSGQRGPNPTYAVRMCPKDPFSSVAAQFYLFNSSTVLRAIDSEIETEMNKQ